ncbi:hypothetical protein B0H17DRAFT_1207436 [Mycena rosella]|uniref:Uncharacterized protein n=1 Tax=Mycena rosella TaxID=1033263 RepID=A0AAD7D2Z5_MYCRO|nr:hypothetical protein B0H17DRAFT_1207436 [Mycena rosella]
MSAVPTHLSHICVNTLTESIRTKLNGARWYREDREILERETGQALRTAEAARRELVLLNAVFSKVARKRKRDTTDGPPGKKTRPSRAQGKFSSIISNLYHPKNLLNATVAPQAAPPTTRVLRSTSKRSLAVPKEGSKAYSTIDSLHYYTRAISFFNPFAPPFESTGAMGLPRRGAAALSSFIRAIAAGSSQHCRVRLMRGLLVGVALSECHLALMDGLFVSLVLVFAPLGCLDFAFAEDGDDLVDMGCGLPIAARVLVPGLDRGLGPHIELRGIDLVDGAESGRPRDIRVQARMKQQVSPSLSPFLSYHHLATPIISPVFNITARLDPTRTGSGTSAQYPLHPRRHSVHASGSAPAAAAARLAALYQPPSLGDMAKRSL